MPGRTDLNYNLNSQKERFVANDAAITEVLALAKQHLSSMNGKPPRSHEEWLNFTLINMLVRICDLQAANTLYLRHQIETVISAIDDAANSPPPKRPTRPA